MSSEPELSLGESLRTGRTFDVRRGEYGADKRTVICKTLAAGAARPDAIARLQNEFEITRELSDAGLVRAIALLPQSTGPVLVMPDDGMTSLDHRIGEGLDPETVRRLAIEISEKLGSLHEQGIIHRDIKPSNVIVDEDMSNVKLIDFCLAIRAQDLANEVPGAFMAQGTVAYMAPEQTGRTNRKVDRRADLYSLGVTLYELLTGERPFPASDQAKLVHQHMTEPPPSLSERVPGAPADLCAAIHTLLAKNPEDRHQTASELRAALSGGRGARVHTGLRIPNRIFGRDELIAKTAREIASPASSLTRLFRIAGASGVGKSAFVREIAAKAIAQGAGFAEGKFDQLDRTRPYTPMVQIANHLVRKILSGPSADVERWRQRILEAVSPNGQVLTDLLPDTVSLIGPQPSVASLGLNEARIRVSMVIRRFFGALSSSEQPLILFIDDMQWSDAASRDLIKQLVVDPEIQHLTLICAYRNAEIGPGHPVTLTYAEIEAQTPLQPEITLTDLDESAVAQLVSETVSQPGDAVADLARLISNKTGGNPFFVRQFLDALGRKGLLHRNPENGDWDWDVSVIEAQRITDNVADLVIERIEVLPQETQTAVRVAAVIGAEFDSRLLSLVLERSQTAVEQCLTDAVDNEVLLLIPDPITDGEKAQKYKFQHDRVQQAAADMTPAEERERRHARIGQLLLDQFPQNRPDRYLTIITDHLIEGRRFLDSEGQGTLQALAVKSAQRTKQANAWDAALRYLDIAEDLLGDDVWETKPQVAFDLTLERAEAAYLRGDGVLAKSIAEGLLERNIAKLDRVQVMELIILLHTSRLAYQKALEAGQKALELLGERLPISPGAPRLLSELGKTKLLLRGRTDDSLLKLPRMTDPEKLAIIRVMGLMAAPAYFTEFYLLPMIGVRIVGLSVKHGNAPHSAYGYVIYGMLHCAVLGQHKRGRSYGELALACAQRHGARDIEGRILMVMAGFIQHWTAPLADTLPVFIEGSEKAIAAGDLEYHGYTRYGHVSYALMAGQPLPKVAELLTGHLAAVTANTHEKTQRIMQMATSSVARMRGLEPELAEPFDADANFALWTEQKDATSLAYFHKYRMLEGLMLGDYTEVLSQAKAIRRNLNGVLAMGYQPFFVFYEALAKAELAYSASYASRQKALAGILLTIRTMCKWSDNAPRTLDHRVHLLKAEYNALRSNTWRAVKHFERAVDSARGSGALHDIGLILERTGLFYQRLGAEEPSLGYLNDAHDAYAVWGAAGWMNALSQRHPAIARRRRALPASVGDTISGGSSSSGEIVDSVTIIRAAEALANKTSLPDVIGEVMRAMVINAGADRGVLMLMGDDTLDVVSVTSPEGTDQKPGGIPFPEFPDIATSVVNFVRRTAQPVVLDDARGDPVFGDDPHFRTGHAVGSVLAVPLMAKGELSGIVYLENTQMRAAFTPERTRTIEVLGAQAAVSVVNARLFDELRGSLERQVDLTSAHARFVPHSFLEMMNRPSIADIRLGDHVQAEASILFSDIRGFTALVESMEPSEAIEFINAYLSRMEPAVQAGGGFVDSYIGDAVMAVFDRGPEAAITAGLEMIRKLRAWTRSQGKAGQAPIRIGIGIATGEMMFGTIGAANRLKCGVIGDAVNLAARIESLTKDYNLGMLITQGTYRKLPDPDRFMIREVDLVEVAGRAAPVRLMEVFDADPQAMREQKLRTRDDVARGLRLYRTGQIDQAASLFDQCRSIAPDDPLLAMLRQRCRSNRDQATGKDWDGIERFGRK